MVPYTFANKSEDDIFTKCPWHRIKHHVHYVLLLWCRCLKTHDLPPVGLHLCQDLRNIFQQRSSTHCYISAKQHIHISGPGLKCAGVLDRPIVLLAIPQTKSSRAAMRKATDPYIWTCAEDVQMSWTCSDFNKKCTESATNVHSKSAQQLQHSLRLGESKFTPLRSLLSAT